MYKSTEQILVIDTESTCWAKNDQCVIDDQGIQMYFPEIIQIGYCWLNPQTLEITNNESIMVKPAHMKISEYCTNLTGITPKLANKGMSFRDACINLIRKAGSRRFVIAGWGEEMEGFLMNHQVNNMLVEEFPFLNGEYLNVSTLSSLFLGMPVRFGLKDTVKRLGYFDWAGTEHNAKWDAYNTAMVLREIARQAENGRRIQDVADRFAQIDFESMYYQGYTGK